MKKIIWYELVQTKHAMIYLVHYLSFQRRLKKAFKIITLIVSLSGVLSWKQFEDYAYIVLLIIAIIQIFTLIESEVLKSDKDIEELGNLNMLYVKYYNQLEIIWVKYNSKKLDENSANEIYFELIKKDKYEIESLVNKLDIKSYNFLRKKSELQTTNYINTHLS